MKPHLYINSKGWPVTRHSYSGSQSFHDCARKYYLERVQGWAERIERSSKFYGIALEAAVTYWHRHKQDTAAAVAEFVRLWAEHKDKPYTYSKTDVSWDVLNLDGQEHIRLYAIMYKTFPYAVNNLLDFQVEGTFEVFPGDHPLHGLEFTSYIDLVAEFKPTKEPIIIDMKTTGKDIPDLIMLDPQLRSYAWVKGWPLVAFLEFRKMGRTVSKGDTATMLTAVCGMEPGTKVFVLGKDLFGVQVVTPDAKLIEEMDAKFTDTKKATKDAQQAFIEEKGHHVPDGSFTKQRIRFTHARVTKESADDIGRAIKNDIVQIAKATELDFFPMQGGIRWPKDNCVNCAMRGICSGNADLRDALVVRKQQDELDFGNDSE